MIGFKIAQAKGLFFDAPAVVSAVDAAARRVLSRFGAIVRRDARQSMRRRKKSAEGGTPPSAHRGLIKRFLFFVFEPVTKSVVIGPAKLNSVQGDDVLELLEHGGVAVRKIGNRRIRVQYPGHAFMTPAFDRHAPSAADMWRDQVR